MSRPENSLRISLSMELSLSQLGEVDREFFSRAIYVRDGVESPRHPRSGADALVLQGYYGAGASFCMVNGILAQSTPRWKPNQMISITAWRVSRTIC